jgi:hypothetical protein
MQNNKVKTNEGVFSSIKKFTDDFFDGLKDDATNRALEKARQNKLPKDVIDSMNRIEDERQTLSQLIKKYSK